MRTQTPLVILQAVTLVFAGAAFAQTDQGATAPAIEAPAPAVKPAIRLDAASIPGNWMVHHPEWRGNIVFYADGTFTRPHVGGGRWEFADDKGAQIVVLRWNVWGIEKFRPTSRDHLEGPTRYGTCHFYRIPAPGVASPATAASDPEKLRALLNDSKWELIDRKRFTLHADGSVTADFDDRKGTWQFTAPNALSIDVPWKPAPAKPVLTNGDATILRWTDDETNISTRQKPNQKS